MQDHYLVFDQTPKVFGNRDYIQIGIANKNTDNLILENQIPQGPDDGYVPGSD